MFGNDNGIAAGGLWIFGLLILLAILGGNGGLFGGGNSRAATQADVQRATDFAALERQNNESVAATRTAAYDVTGAIKDGNYNILGELRDIQAVTASGFASAKECCCEILRAIDSAKYDSALNTASINANITATGQKILDRMAQDREASMQARINQLELDRALCGIPRTNPYGYGIYSTIPSMSGCGCGNSFGYGYAA